MNSHLYGYLAEFHDAESLRHAAETFHSKGYRRIEAYTPYPIEGLSESIGFHKNRLPLLVLIGGIIGGSGGYLLQYWVATSANPYNIGGRPLVSWPAFIPVTFEMTVLVAAIFAVLGMLALNGLPMPHHPLFQVPAFSRVSRDKLFFFIESNDPLFDIVETKIFLQSLSPQEIIDVEK